jgi:hypothetical protein
MGAWLWRGRRGRKPSPLRHGLARAPDFRRAGAPPRREARASGAALEDCIIPSVKE